MTAVAVIDPTGEIATTVEALLHRGHDQTVRCVDDLAAGLDFLERDGVLVAGPTLASRRGVAALQRVHRDAPAIRTVLAFDRRPGASMAEVVAIGADALVAPADAPALRAALERAIRASRELVPLAAIAEAPRPTGTVVTVTSATGGCGKTFAATSLASSLAAWTDTRVALVDLDLQFGEVAPVLGMRVRRGWSDLVGVAASDVGAYVDDALVAHSSGAAILAAPPDPALADQIDGASVGAVIDHLRATFDVVVVDTSTGLSEATLAAVDRTDELVVMSLLDVASIRNLRTLDRTLDRLGVAESLRRLVLNKDRSGIGLTADQVERALERTFVARIPFSDDVPRSMNGGRTAVLDHPEAGLLGPLLDLLVAVAPEGERDGLDAHRPAARSRRLWPRRPWPRGRARGTSPNAHREPGPGEPTPEGAP